MVLFNFIIVIALILEFVNVLNLGISQLWYARILAKYQLKPAKKIFFCLKTQISILIKKNFDISEWFISFSIKVKN